MSHRPESFSDRRFLYQTIGGAILNRSNKRTPEAERGMDDALNAKVYRDSFRNRRDPTSSAEYDLGWELGRWLKITKRPATNGIVYHAEADKLLSEFAASRPG